MALHKKKNSSRINTPNKASNSGQRGGTLLGLIIGLIIGLGIALVVALSITKAGFPFIKKGAQPRAAEGSGGAIVVDPNKPLYGNKDAARQAARDQAPPAENAVPATPAMPITPATPTTPATMTPESPPAAAAAAKPGTSEDKFIYYLQAGAFREQADADSIKAKLALLGVEASVTERRSDSGTLYRVRVGPFSQIETMNGIREKLSENGVDVAVVRSPK